MSAQPFASLKSAIDRLETAWAEGNLGAVLAEEGELFAGVLGGEILESYEKLAADQGHGPTAFRKRAVYGLVDRVRRALQRPRYWFEVQDGVRLPVPGPHAAPYATPGGGGGGVFTEALVDPDDLERRPEPAGTSSTTGRRRVGPLRAFLPTGGEVSLRLDQVLGARQWEIGFRCEEPDLARSLEELTLRDTLRRLAANLRDLRKVERGANQLWIDEHPNVVAAETACRFEQLMIDIINEHSRIAQHASLLEDLTEKTDLRVNFADLQRKRGARVQVTSILNSHELGAKIGKIRHPEEIVILSPLTMAETWAREDVGELLSTTERDGFWRCLQGKPANPHELAQGLNRVFFRALAAADHQMADPRGPMALVPEPVRRFVQAFVTAESLRATRTMRHNQQNGLSVMRRRRGFGRRKTQA